MLKLYKLIARLLNSLIEKLKRFYIFVLNLIAQAYVTTTTLLGKLFGKLNDLFWEALARFLEHTDEIMLSAVQGELSFLDKWTDGGVFALRRAIRKLIGRFLYFLRNQLIVMIVAVRKILFALIRSDMWLTKFISQHFDKKRDNYNYNKITQLSEFQFDIYYFLIYATFFIIMFTICFEIMHAIDIAPYIKNIGNYDAETAARLKEYASLMNKKRTF